MGLEPLPCSRFWVLVLDERENHVPVDLKGVDLLEVAETVVVVEKGLSVGVDLEALVATADGKLLGGGSGKRRDRREM